MLCQLSYCGVWYSGTVAHAAGPYGLTHYTCQAPPWHWRDRSGLTRQHPRPDECPVHGCPIFARSRARSGLCRLSGCHLCRERGGSVVQAELVGPAGVEPAPPVLPGNRRPHDVRSGSRPGRGRLSGLPGKLKNKRGLSRPLSGLVRRAASKPPTGEEIKPGLKPSPHIGAQPSFTGSP